MGLGSPSLFSASATLHSVSLGFLSWKNSGFAGLNAIRSLDLGLVREDIEVVGEECLERRDSPKLELPLFAPCGATSVEKSLDLVLLNSQYWASDCLSCMFFHLSLGMSQTAFMFHPPHPCYRACIRPGFSLFSPPLM